MHVKAQFGVFAGPSVLVPFGAQKTFAGFHIGGELSVDDETTYFLRISNFAAAKDLRVQVAGLEPLNPMLPFSQTTYTTKTGYNVISGGAR